MEPETKKNNEAGRPETCTAKETAAAEAGRTEEHSAKESVTIETGKRSVGNMWASSAGELKSLRNVVFCGVMGAMAIVLSFVGTIRLGPTMKIGISKIPNLMVDCLFGPFVGGLFGAVMDVLKYLVNPDGTFFPGFALSAAVAAVIYGCFWYRKKLTIWRILIPEVLVKILVNLGLNTLWLELLYGKGFLVLLVPRIASNLIQLPVDVLVSWIVLNALQKAAKKFRQY